MMVSASSTSRTRTSPRPSRTCRCRKTRARTICKSPTISCWQSTVPAIWTLAQYQDQSKYFANTLTEGFDRDLSFAAGIRVYDISVPAAPREIAFMPIFGLGANRIWWVGGRYAYVAVHMEGYTDHVMAVIDLSVPERPTMIGQWWLPGQWTQGGEVSKVPKGKRHAAHHAIVAGKLAYGTWRDGGITIHDVSDPTSPRMLSHLNWCPPFAGGTHTALPLPDRNLLVVRRRGHDHELCQRRAAHLDGGRSSSREPGAHLDLSRALRG